MAELEWDRIMALEQTGGDEALLAELLDLFRESAAANLDELRRAVAADKATAAAEAAHSLKGAAASLGLESIRRLAEAVEHAGRTGSLSVARASLPDLADLLTQLNAF